MASARVYRILTAAEWELAQAAGRVPWSPQDRADGYLHLSSAEQAPETVRRHFADCRELVVLEIDAAILGDDLRWEPARDGDLFPHLYAHLPLDKVRAARRVEAEAP